MEQRIDINMNAMAEVELTEAGIQAMERYRQGIRDTAARLKINLGELYSDSPRERMPLWELANIFGPQLFNGGRIPFVQNKITVIISEEMQRCNSSK